MILKASTCAGCGATARSARNERLTRCCLALRLRRLAHTLAAARPCGGSDQDPGRRHPDGAHPDSCHRDGLVTLRSHVSTSPPKGCQAPRKTTRMAIRIEAAGPSMHVGSAGRSSADRATSATTTSSGSHPLRQSQAKPVGRCVNRPCAAARPSSAVSLARSAGCGSSAWAIARATQYTASRRANARSNTYRRIGSRNTPIAARRIGRPSPKVCRRLAESDEPLGRTSGAHMYHSTCHAQLGRCALA